MGVNHQIRFASLKSGLVDVVLPRLNHSPFFHDRNTVRNDSLGVETVAMSRDGQVAASGGVDRTVCLWEGETGRFLTMLEGFESTITDLCFSPNGDRLVTLESAGRVVLWEIQKSAVDGPGPMTAKVLWQTDDWDSQPGSDSSLQGGRVITFGPHGTQLAVGLSHNPDAAAETEVDECLVWGVPQ